MQTSSGALPQLQLHSQAFQAIKQEKPLAIPGLQCIAWPAGEGSCIVWCCCIVFTWAAVLLPPYSSWCKLCNPASTSCSSSMAVFPPDSSYRFFAGQAAGQIHLILTVGTQPARSSWPSSSSSLQQQHPPCPRQCLNFAITASRWGAYFIAVITTPLLSGCPG